MCSLGTNLDLHVHIPTPTCHSLFLSIHSLSKPPMDSNSMAKRPKPPSDHFNMDALLTSFLSLSDSPSIHTSFDRLIQSTASDSDQNRLIQRALRLGSLLLDAANRSARRCSSDHNAVVWPLSPDLTIKIFSTLDTQSVCYVAATCSFFQKCAMDPSCFANIDLATLVPKVNNAVVSTMIHRAGDALKSIRLGVLPIVPAPPFFSSQPLVYSIRNANDASGFSWNDKKSRQGKESSILTRSCLNSLSGNGGAPGYGVHLRRLHLYNIERMDNASLLTSLSACPSLVDLEIVGLHVELRHTLESISRNCPLIERLVFESSKTGRDDGLKFPTCNEFVHNCPNITTLALKGFKLHDYKARMLVKGLRRLKHLDLSTSYSFTGAFLKNVSGNGGGGGDNLEVMILRDCMHLKEIEVERFMAAVLAGEFKLLRHLDISNREGLACEGDWSNRCYNASFIPIQQLLEQRPDFCLVAEFPKGSYNDNDQMIGSDVSLASQSSNSHTSDGSTTSDGSYNSDHGSGYEYGRESGFTIYEENSDYLMS
ncbi:putative leucine-rich repeat domain superfamily, F-box-like domain superfamily [Helianthus annuus]|nr:putative leucine-rich repeat domain superfamily, F-box-like domain superfamily [Helianthus annuus]KAJ0955429.1 putative leucine-rich repeat domain superfamily, F-box-like domain superfamily [Helianthus annuus]